MHFLKPTDNLLEIFFAEALLKGAELSYKIFERWVFVLVRNYVSSVPQFDLSVDRQNIGMIVDDIFGVLYGEKADENILLCPECFNLDVFARL